MADIQMHVAPSWEYVPVAPYRVCSVSLSLDPNRPAPYIEWRPTMKKALQLFERCRSPLPERSVVLSDFNEVTLLSYNTGTWDLRWIGVAAAFESMREHATLTPLEVDLAEIEAHAGWSTDE